MADVEDCQKALNRLADSLAAVESDVRAKHVPRRTVSCTISDLNVTFVGRVDEDGVHDVALSDGEASQAEVRVVVASDDLMALSDGTDDLVRAWLKGRVQISAPVRDMLRLRAVIGI